MQVFRGKSVKYLAMSEKSSNFAGPFIIQVYGHTPNNSGLDGMLSY